MYMNINQYSVKRVNTILIVIYCLWKYQLNWRLSPVLLEIKKQELDKLIDKCVRLNLKYIEIQILQRRKAYLSFLRNM